MKNAPRLAVIGIAEIVVIAIYALDSFGDLDLGSSAAILRIVVVVCAAAVAVVTFQTWSHDASVRTTCAMVLGLLGGAALASSAISGKDGEVFGSSPMALVGTVGLALAVVVTQLGLLQDQEVTR